MVKYDSLDPRWYRESDFELLDTVVKIVMIMSKLGWPHSSIISEANSEPIFKYDPPSQSLGPALQYQHINYAYMPLRGLTSRKMSVFCQCWHFGYFRTLTGSHFCLTLLGFRLWTHITICWVWGLRSKSNEIGRRRPKLLKVHTCIGYLVCVTSTHNLLATLRVQLAFESALAFWIQLHVSLWQFVGAHCIPHVVVGSSQTVREYQIHTLEYDASDECGLSKWRE